MPNGLVSARVIGADQRLATVRGRRVSAGVYVSKASRRLLIFANIPFLLCFSAVLLCDMRNSIPETILQAPRMTVRNCVGWAAKRRS